MAERLRALVLEDEWAARNYLVQLLEQSQLANVVAATAGTAVATEALAASPEPVDVAFVDIHLAGERHPESAGLTWIESLGAPSRNARHPPPRVVLTSASKEHAMRAFELGVVDYLLKPFTAARVKTSLERLAGLERAPRSEKDPLRIVARQGRNLVFLERDEAWAFEAEGRLCYVHTPRGRLDIDLSLTSLEAVLGPGWLRVHRNWLVSLARVKSMERADGEAVLHLAAPGPLRVPVARDRAASVKERVLESTVGLRREG
jgi:two-component system, LytTR family, response regulator LytT